MNETEPASKMPVPPRPGRGKRGIGSRGRLQGFLALDRRDRSLFIEAALVLAAVRAALVLVPFARLRRTLNGMATRFPRRLPADIEGMTSVIVLAGRHIPRTDHCLTQALAGQFMLARSGVPTRLRIGLARAPEERLHGHAWLERDGSILIGETEAAEYQEVESFGGELR